MNFNKNIQIIKPRHTFFIFKFALLKITIMLTKKIPAYALFIAVILTCLLSFAFTSSHYKKIIDNTSIISTNTNLPVTTCDFTVNRLSGRKFIKPLLYAEKSCEAENFVNVKSAVRETIDNLKANKQLSNASVYLRLFSHGEWMKINDEVQYQPGSLFKVPLLITYLRLEEHTPSLLNKKFTFSSVTSQSKQFKQAFVKNQIQLGSAYTVKELLKYMIVHSDNNATMLLFNNIPALEFEKTFTDLGLDKNMTKSEGVVSASAYSRFWITLYNGSYLNFDNSEFALSLLSQTDFKEGITHDLPPNVIVAHKFGEKGNSVENCLHETAIVYTNHIPYLLTVMTVGSNQANLSKSIQEISSVIYNNILSLTQ
jgi:beta-lactamase class A